MWRDNNNMKLPNDNMRLEEEEQSVLMILKDFRKSCE
jgi:hypothetical protein